MSTPENGFGGCVSSLFWAFVYTRHEAPAIAAALTRLNAIAIELSSSIWKPAFWRDGSVRKALTAALPELVQLMGHLVIAAAPGAFHAIQASVTLGAAIGT